VVSLNLAHPVDWANNVLLMLLQMVSHLRRSQMFESGGV